MKTLFVSLVAFFSVHAFASEPVEVRSGDAFIRCYGYHHGSYLDFYSNADASKITIEVSGDGDEPAQGWSLYNVTKVEKWHTAIASADYYQTLIDVVPAMKGEAQYDYVFVEADGPNNSKMYLNLNNWVEQSYLVIDGQVETLTCSIPQN